MISAHKELDAFLDRKATVFYLAVMNLARAKFTGGDLQAARKELAETIQRTMILADFKGRERLLMEYDAAKRGAKFADISQTSPIVPGIVFEEAVEDMFKREPRLARSAAEVSRLYSTSHAFAMARSAEMTITRRAQDEITKWLAGGTPGAAIEKTLTEIGPFSEAYAATVYRTNVAEAYNMGRVEQAKDEDVSDIIVGFRFEGVLDAFTRPNHSAGFGSIAATDDPIWKNHRPPLGYNCVLPETVVGGRFTQASRMLYDGEIIKITLESGASVSVTPNHPIPSTRGLILAADLNERDSLLKQRSTGASGPVDKVDKENPPARIDEVFRSFAKRGCVSRLDVGGHDFYGDALFGKGEIEIVYVPRMLTLESVSTADEGEPKGILVPLNADAAHTDGFSPSDFLRSRHRSSSRGLPGGGALALHLPAITVSPLEEFSFGASAYLDTPTLKPYQKAGPLDAEFSSEMIKRFPRLVAADRIVKIERFAWSGHVYDLQSSSGWILANDIYISNCRCSLEFVSRFEAERLGLWKDEKLVRHVASSAAWYPDPGFKGEGV